MSQRTSYASSSSSSSSSFSFYWGRRCKLSSNKTTYKTITAIVSTTGQNNKGVKQEATQHYVIA